MEEEVNFGPQITPSGRIVPLSERQQMALLKRIEEARKVTTSPKPDNPQPIKDRSTNRKLYNKLNKRNDRGETALHRSTIKGDLEKVNELLSQGADVNMKDFAGWTALHEACNHGYLEIVKTLIGHGADVNVRGLDGDNPLHDAAVNGHEEITIALIQSGANPEAENDAKETPLEVAEDPETRRLLLEGIPIFKEFEKIRRRKLETHKADFADCLTTEDADEDSSPTTLRKRSDSVFSSEEASSTNVKAIKSPVKTEETNMAKDKKEKKKKEEREKEREDAEERRIRKQKKKEKERVLREQEAAKLEKIQQEKEKEREKEKQAELESVLERDRRWKDEIMRKVKQEAEKKGLTLTEQQFKKVVERRLAKKKEKIIKSEDDKKLEKPLKSEKPEKTGKIEKPKLEKREKTQSLSPNDKPKKDKRRDSLTDEKLKITKESKSKPLVLPKLEAEKIPKREKISSNGSHTEVSKPESKDGESNKKKLKRDKDTKKDDGRKLSDINFLDQADLLRRQQEKLKVHKTKQKEIRDRDHRRYKEIQRQKELEKVKRMEKVPGVGEETVRERSSSTEAISDLKKIGEKRERHESTQSVGSSVMHPPSLKKPKIEPEIDCQLPRLVHGGNFVPVVPPPIEPVPIKPALKPVIQIKEEPADFYEAPEKAKTKPTTLPPGAIKPPAPHLPQIPVAAPAHLYPTPTPPQLQEQHIPQQPVEVKVTQRVSVIQKTPLAARKKTFKPKFAWMTEAGHGVFEKRIEEEKTRKIPVKVFGHKKLSKSFLEKYSQETKRKTVHDEKLNEYDERNCINQRINKEWAKISPIIPDAPPDIENFSLFTGKYHLEGSIQDRMEFQKNAPPSELPPKMQDLFKSQEDARWRMRQAQIVALEKLKLAYEQRILRCYATAKRAQSQQTEYSATIFLMKDFANQYETPDEPVQPPKESTRNRYTPRVLKGLLDDAQIEFKAKQSRLVAGHRMEWESTYMTQITEWHLKALQVDRDTAPKSIDSIGTDLVPKIISVVDDNFMDV